MRIFRKLFESKADEQKLIDYVGEDLAKRFFNIKQRLQGQEKDLYYWLKKEPAELEARVSEIENTQTRRDKEKEAREGAKLVAENEYYKVYHITTYEASVKYGKGTQWCISGSKRWSNGERGEEYFNDYTSQGIEFYFFIPKTNENEKYAIAFAPSTKQYQIFNETDDEVREIPKAPKVEGVYIPIRYKEFSVKYFDFEEAELLSIKKASNLPKDVLKYGEWWWLSDRGIIRHSAVQVTENGNIDFTGQSKRNTAAVRPVVHLEGLRNRQLRPFDSIKINNIRFIVIGPASILYDDKIMSGYRFDDGYKDYKESEIKRFVDNWFKDFTSKK